MATRLVRVFLVLLALSQFAGSCHGTETGNPGVTPVDNGAEGGSACLIARGVAAAVKDQATDGSDQAVDDLIARICARLIGCGSTTTTDTCFNALNATDGDRMTDEFGLSPGTTVVQLRAGLIAGSILVTSTSLPTCEGDLETLSCLDVLSTAPGNDFSDIETLIPSSCSTVFSPAPAPTNAPADCP